MLCFIATVSRMGSNVTNNFSLSSCLYRASVMIKTLYYPTDAQICNS